MAKRRTKASVCLYQTLLSVCCERAVDFFFIDIANTTRAKCQREGVFVPPAAMVNNTDHNHGTGMTCNWYNSQTERGQDQSIIQSNSICVAKIPIVSSERITSHYCNANTIHTHTYS